VLEDQFVVRKDDLDVIRANICRGEFEDEVDQKISRPEGEDKHPEGILFELCTDGESAILEFFVQQDRKKRFSA